MPGRISPVPPIVVVDRRRDIGLVVLICAVAGLGWTLRSKSEASGTMFWLSLAYSGVLVATSFGIWRASEWARWVGGLASISGTIRLLLSFRPMLSGSTSGHPGAKMIAYGMAFGMVLFWTAIAFYLLRPSTGKLFAQVRAARVPGATSG